MDLPEIRKQLGTLSRTKVSKETGLKPMWLYAVETERIKDPGSKKLDVLRSYLLSQQIKSHPPG